MYYILIKKITIGPPIFYCMAVVKKVNAENGWHYISCIDCHKNAKTIGSIHFGVKVARKDFLLQQ